MIDITAGKMDPEIKREWVTALRSGEFPQGRDWLERKGKFCCLGVLCSIATERGNLTRHQDGERVEYAHNSFPISAKALPIALYGLTTTTGSFSVGIQVYSLAMLNDQGFTFDQIADIIEYIF